METQKLLTTIIDVKVKGKKIGKINIGKTIVYSTIGFLLLFSILCASYVLSKPSIDLVIVEGAIKASWGFYNANGCLSATGITMLVFFIFFALMFGLAIYTVYNKSLIINVKHLWMIRFTLYFLMGLICFLMICGWAQSNHTSRVNGTFAHSLSYMFNVRIGFTGDGVTSIWCKYSGAGIAIVTLSIFAFLTLPATIIARYFYIRNRVTLSPIIN